MGIKILFNDANTSNSDNLNQRIITAVKIEMLAKQKHGE